LINQLKISKENKHGLKGQVEDERERNKEEKKKNKKINRKR
jgi:hypothetical protein